ncbi:SH2 domain-containing protein 7-like isoform X2 [Melanotaenia boesemani]|uniref:SH2 domain-containing protein 7-like isoform X2 n=1 Tax=Melanotaenia boesemani TaxID=1250792 RepID=UPI001C03D2D3|nr:SH2 domain-containing protein 7-like isoform X2 [Melanotaenia boesemani]
MKRGREFSDRDAEEILREKELGCFLVRLSDKAIGYILSYKGRDRCRHFVISQSETGQFVVYGDTEGHNTLHELIEYYKTRPIEPFREYLTSSCFEALDGELYDMIQVSPKETPIAALRPAKKNIRRQQVNTTTQQQPTRAPKNRTQEEVPPLPQRSRHLDSSTLNDQDKIFYAQLRKQTPREGPRIQHFSQDYLPGAKPGKAERLTPKDQNNGRYSPPSEPESVYSELSLLESKSRSLPLLDSSSDTEQSYRLSAPPNTPPRLSPKPVRQAARCTPQSKETDLWSRANNSNSLDCISDTAIYHLASRSGRQSPTPYDNRTLSAEQHSDSVYAEVASEALTFAHDSTYEILPDHMETAKSKPNSSTYEPVEDIRRNPICSSGCLKNNKWKWLFPETKRK